MSYLNKKIKGLTINYEDNIKNLTEGLLLRYVNKDYYINIEAKIRNELSYYKKYGKGDEYKKVNVALSYWRYKFLIAIARSQEEIDYAYSALRESYKMGSSDAAAEYGYFYYVGNGPVGQDKQKAMKLFKKASKGDSLWLEYLMGEAFTHNERDENVLKQAVPYYEKALEKKVTLARKKLADLYSKLGINIDKAIKLYEIEGKESGENYSLIIDRLKNRKR